MIGPGSDKNHFKSLIWELVEAIETPNCVNQQQGDAYSGSPAHLLLEVKVFKVRWGPCLGDAKQQICTNTKTDAKTNTKTDQASAMEF